MSYEKNTWVTGDVITAEKLNHIENGVPKITYIGTHLDGNNKRVLDKTWQEIHDLLAQDNILIARVSGDISQDGVIQGYLSRLTIFEVQFTDASFAEGSVQYMVRYNNGTSSYVNNKDDYPEI